MQAQPEAALVTGADHESARPKRPATSSGSIAAPEISIAMHDEDAPLVHEPSRASAMPAPVAEPENTRAEPSVLAATPTVADAHSHPPAETVSLSLPSDSELVMVETRFAPVVETEEPVAPRPRRARPARPVIPDEPLQMVETRKEQPAP
jgi:hypothetical protein